MPMWSNLKSLKILSCLDIEVKYSQNFYFFFAFVEEVSLWDPGETRRGREWKHCLVLLEFLLGIKETVCQEPTTKTHKSSSYCIHYHSKINHQVNHQVSLFGCSFFYAREQDGPKVLTPQIIYFLHFPFPLSFKFLYFFPLSYLCQSRSVQNLELNVQF